MRYPLPTTNSSSNSNSRTTPSSLLPLSSAPGLPERPDPGEGIEAYSVWLDSMCAHVRHMAHLAAVAYHRDRVEHHSERLAAMGETA